MTEDEKLIKYLSEHLEYYLDELCKPQPKCADGTAGEFAARGTLSMAKIRLKDAMLSDEIERRTTDVIKSIGGVRVA